MNYVLILIVTGWAGSFFYGEVGAFAMIKYSIAKQFELSQSFLGQMDGMRQLGNFIGCIIFLVFPLRKPKRDFFFLSLIKCILFMMFSMGKVLQTIEPLYMVLMFCIGVTKIGIVCPSYILYKTLDPQEYKFELGIWVSVLSLGDMVSVLLGELILNVLQLDWSVFILIFDVILFLSTLPFFLYLEETPLEGQEGVSTMQIIENKVNDMKLTLYSLKRSLLLSQLVLMSVFYYNTLLWFPFYFKSIDFQHYSSYLSVVFSLALVLGSFLFQYITKVFQIKSKLISFILLFFTALVFLCMCWVGQSQGMDKGQRILLFFILILCGSLLLSGPFNRVGASQLYEVSENDQKIGYYMLTLFHFFRCILNFISLLLIGHFLQSSLTSLFWILFINSILILIVNGCRNILYQRNYMEVEQTNVSV